MSSEKDLDNETGLTDQINDNLQMDSNIATENKQSSSPNTSSEKEFSFDELKVIEDDVNDLIGDKPNDNNQGEEEKPKKKRGLPKAILEGQKKYLELLEKQQKMMGKKKGTNLKKNTKEDNLPEPVKREPENTAGKRRVIVAGKVKYLPIKKQPEMPKESVNSVPDDKPTKTEKPVEVKNTDPVIKEPEMPNTEPSKIVMDEEITLPETKSKKIPSALLKKMEQHKNLVETGKIAPKKKAENVSSSRIPSKYAKQIEKDIKKQTTKNVKNFGDLRRIKALENIAADTDIDTNRASINELRKLKAEQRRREQEESRKKASANKRESALQEILNNDNLSKFAKAVAIKNLSINSRNKKSIVEQKN